MKFTEGTLKRSFEEVAPDYPDIEPGTSSSTTPPTSW